VSGCRSGCRCSSATASCGFGHDGTLVGEAVLPEKDIDRGRPMLGLVNAPGDNTPTYAASFNDVEVRIIAG
jgi:hypothetical protein